MSNGVFGWPIYSDASVLFTPTFSGGSWSSALPLANVADRRLAKVARSSNVLVASTKFETDLQTARNIRVLALILPNISSVGTCRVRGSNVAGNFAAPVYDSGTVTVYPAGQTAETMDGIKPTFVAVTPALVSARYWLFEVTDTANAAGYIDIARVVIAGGWQPTYNLSYGAQFGLETDTERNYTDGGAAVYKVSPRRRTLVFEHKLLTDTEALTGFDIQRVAGTSQQLFYVFDPADTTHMHRRAFLATLRSLSALEYAFFNGNTLPFQLVEEL
jgi:hypothetical protein